MITILHVIYIIHQETGVCLIERGFSSTIEIDSNLISGYLTAFKNYGREVSKGSGDLKIINMGIYYLIMVNHESLFLVAVADKRDDKNIIFHNLNKLLSNFLAKYKQEVENWKGNIAVFREFREKIDEILEEGKIGEVELKIPILKSFKKPFMKFKNEMITKQLIMNTDDFEQFIEAHKNPPWVREKKLPMQVISQGFFSQEAYNIAHKFDGLHTPEEVSEETGLNEEDLNKIITTLEDLGLLDYIDTK